VLSIILVLDGTGTILSVMGWPSKNSNPSLVSHAMTTDLKTITYGDMEVSILTRDWMTTIKRLPLWKPRTQTGAARERCASKQNQWEYYVLLEPWPVPIGAMIARELMVPDVIECFPNGRIGMREAKHVSTNY
jgi:hypothetical protein